jgi:hypothetical protein
MPNAAPAAIPALPFVASSHEHVEPAFTVTVTPGAATQQLNPIDIPAYGYLRYLFLEVSASGGAGGTLAADGPWNLFQSINLQDVNGSNIFGPLDGYSTYLTNLLGGYANRSNPADSPFYVGAAPNPVFYLRIPVEISRKNGLGALANQNSAANYKLAMTINTAAAMASVAFTTPPTFTIRGWLEAWTLPAAQDSRGRPQAQVPPLLGTGQYWSSRTQSGILAGSNTVALTRLGNYIRTLVFVARDNTGARADTVFPDPWQWNWDGMTLRTQSQRYSHQDFYEKTDGTVTRPTGVFVLPFNHGGPLAAFGNEDPDLWLPTTQSSRLEIAGTSAVAGSIQVLTNEVAPIEQDQAARYISPNQDATLAAPTVTR